MPVCFHSDWSSSFLLSPSGPYCAAGKQDYLRLWHCHFTWGSTCAPEVLILMLNRLDTKTNKLSSLHRTGLKTYGHGEGYAITAANLRSPNQPHSQCPPSTLIFKYWGAQIVCKCVCVCVGVLVEVPPHSCKKVRQHQGDQHCSSRTIRVSAPQGGICC